MIPLKKGVDNILVTLFQGLNTSFKIIFILSLGITNSFFYIQLVVLLITYNFSNSIIFSELETINFSIEIYILSFKILLYDGDLGVEDLLISFPIIDRYLDRNLNVGKGISLSLSDRVAFFIFIFSYKRLSLLLNL